MNDESMMKEDLLKITSHLPKGGSSCTSISSFNSSVCVLKYIPKFHKKIDFEYKRKKADLYKESAVLLKLNHRNIIKVMKQIGKEALCDPFGNVFQAHSMVLEYIPSPDLSALAMKSLLSEDETKGVSEQLFDALSYIHSKGFAHRDIKPENILLQVGSEILVKLIDFGFSEQLLPGETQKNDFFGGTAEYMAPELWNHICYDPIKADVFALGVTLLVLMTGKFPCKSKCCQSDPVYKLVLLRQYTDFWKIMEKSGAKLSTEFKNMIQEMIAPSIYSRPTIDQVKNCPWAKLKKASLSHQQILGELLKLREGGGLVESPKK